MVLLFKKYHKWIGVVVALLLLLFAISGIILNHRNLLSPVDVDRSFLPDEYQIVNWNNAAVKGTEKITHDSILIYGNIGIWLTDSSFANYKDFNSGIPEGIDNRKVCKVLLGEKGDLWAGTLFGLFKYNFEQQQWENISIPTREKRVVDIVDFGDSLYMLTRSHLLVYKNEKFKVRTLPPPENYDNKIGLFKTLWVIHSGEIYGFAGKILVNLVGLIFIFLTITGFILFVNRYRVQKKFNAKKPIQKIKKINLWNLRWHNKIGWITLIFLIITTTTGMFLRPPLLVTIANMRVGKIPGTELATANPWFDQLRRILYDKENNRFILATFTGFYYSDDNFKSELKVFKNQPPASIMGVNVLKRVNKNQYLIGSFEGLFRWNPATAEIFDVIKKEPYVKKEIAGPPIGDYLITGYSDDFDNQEVAFDYDKGALNINNGKQFPAIPSNVRDAYRISLWSLALEIHTGRIYESLLGIFYVLIVPLTGLITLFILISGFIVWWKLHRLT